MLGKFVDLGENKRGLGNVHWKSSNNDTSWNISVAFLQSCLSINGANECLTGVNMKRNQETQRSGKRQHLKTNQKLYNENVLLLTSFARSEWESTVFAFGFFAQTSLLRRSRGLC